MWLTQTMGHYGVGNSAALRLAEVARETKDPPGGTIDRMSDGTPTGVLKESAQGLVRRLLPDETAEQLDAGIRDLAKAFNAEGMTGLKDPGISPATWDIDGSGGARTAWLYDDWNIGFTGIDSGNCGYPASNPDTVRQLIRLYHDAGIHVSTHSIGDRGIDWTVDSYAQAMRENPTRGLRHGIIHANIPTDRAIDSIAKLQREFDADYPEPSATFMWWIGDTYAGNFGPVRDRRLRRSRRVGSRSV